MANSILEYNIKHAKEMKQTLLDSKNQSYNNTHHTQERKPGLEKATETEICKRKKEKY